MNVVAIIPARIASTRFPGKMLAAETGKPMIVHVCEQVARANDIDRIIVATDDHRIEQAVTQHGFVAMLTASHHENGTSRIVEAASALQLNDDAIVVNVQGDEPEIEPASIERCVTALAQERECMIATLACPFNLLEDASDPSVVKVVMTQQGRALYFSRAKIPFDRDETGDVLRYKHVGLYAYRMLFLRAYASLTPTPLERSERLEQLRFLEHGWAVAVAVVPAGSHRHGIDTPEQYRAFVQRHREQSSG
ncbi:MAG: 3-deoxy-manno-octulosonate cytidylyltransferase [Phycisphaerales bacterium]